MPNFALQLQGAFTNAEGLVPADGVGAALLVRVECTSCHEMHPNAVTLDPANVDELHTGRGEANLVISCPLCRRENSATFVVKKPGAKGEGKLGEVSPYTPVSEGGFGTVCTVEFRGLQPHEPGIDDVLPEGTAWACTGTSGTPFGEVQFEDGEWHDYDENAGDEVSITDVQMRWHRV